MVKQRTLKRVVKASGIGLHSGQKVLINFVPHHIDGGIVFRRIDLNPPVDIPANALLIQEAFMCSNLVREDIKVGTIEHVMSAIAGLGIDSTSNCDDIFVITIGDLADSFEYDGVVYGVNIVETTLSLNSLSPAACATAGAAPNCIGFKTQEGKATDAQFGIFINAIPEPAGIAGVGLGIVGLMVMNRRRKMLISR